MANRISALSLVLLVLASRVQGQPLPPALGASATPPSTTIVIPAPSQGGPGTGGATPSGSPNTTIIVITPGGAQTIAGSGTAGPVQVIQAAASPTTAGAAAVRPARTPSPLHPIVQASALQAADAQPEAAPAPSVLTGDSFAGSVTQQSRFWVHPEALLWWIAPMQLPPLVTGSLPGTPQGQAGVLGQPGTFLLYGDQKENGDGRLGCRLSGGFWFDEGQVCGLEWGFLYLGNHSSTTAIGSDGSQIVARPFVDATTGDAASELVSFPGNVAGTVTVNAKSDPLYGCNVRLRTQLCGDCGWRIDLLCGYRFLRFDEELQVQENLTSLDPATFGASIVVTDNFTTHNEFHGADFGVLLQRSWDRWSLETRATLGVGHLQRTVIINGSTVVTVAGLPPVGNSGGLLALPGTNIGRYESGKLVLVPELNLTAGYQLTSWLKATCGYTFLWWTDLARPGDQVDLAVNPSFIPPPTAVGPRNPAFNLRSSDLWVQGIRLGLQFEY